MKVILLEDVKTVGKKNDVVEVSEGYAKNFLLKKKLATAYTAASQNDVKLARQHEEKVAAQNLEAAKELAKKLEERKVSVSLKAGVGGAAFGSVSSKEIARAYKEQYGEELDKKKLVLAEPLKNFGTYEIKVKLHPQVTGMLRVSVTEM